MVETRKFEEAKQVGELYHFTTIERFDQIILTKVLKPSYNHVYGSGISFTRNKNFQKDVYYFQDKVIRLTLDGDKLSNQYKIKPYQDSNFQDEQEEFLITEKDVPIFKYIKDISVIKDDGIDTYDNLSKLLYTAYKNGIKIKILEEKKMIELKEGQRVIDIDGNDYEIEKGDILKENTLLGRLGEWRLPNKRELDLMYEDLHLKGIGNFGDDNYWSSTEESIGEAWGQFFQDGFQFYSGFNKSSSSHRVRLVRTVELDKAYVIGEETPTGIVLSKIANLVLECKKEDEKGRGSWYMTWYEAVKEFGV